MRSIALEHAFPVLMGTSALDRTIYTLERTSFRISLILVKCDFVDLQVSFLMTPRTHQLEFNNSRYVLFGRTHWVRIIAPMSPTKKAISRVVELRFSVFGVIRKLT